jgi:hypothetical protein
MGLKLIPFLGRKLIVHQAKKPDSRLAAFQLLFHAVPHHMLLRLIGQYISFLDPRF